MREDFRRTGTSLHWYTVQVEAEEEGGKCMIGEQILAASYLFEFKYFWMLFCTSWLVIRATLWSPARTSSNRPCRPFAALSTSLSIAGVKKAFHSNYGAQYHDRCLDF